METPQYGCVSFRIIIQPLELEPFKTSLVDWSAGGARIPLITLITHVCLSLTASIHSYISEFAWPSANEVSDLLHVLLLNVLINRAWQWRPLCSKILFVVDALARHQTTMILSYQPQPSKRKDKSTRDAVILANF